MEADVEISPSQTDQQFLQPSKSADINRKRTFSMQRRTKSGAESVRVLLLPACMVEGIFDGLETIRSLQPSLDLSSLAGGGQPHHGSSSHAVTKDTAVGSASKLQRPADMVTF